MWNVLGERGQRHRRRGEDEEGRDEARAARAEALHAVPQAACEEGDPEHEDAVGEDRADERRLHDGHEALVQGEERDEELRQVAERRLDDAGRAGAEAGAELLGRVADEAREGRQGDRGDDERRHVAEGEVADGSQRDERERHPELDEFAAIHIHDANNRLPEWGR